MALVPRGKRTAPADPAGRAATPVLGPAPPYPAGGGHARVSAAPPGGGPPAGSAHARTNPPDNRGQPPLPPPGLPPPPPPRRGRPGPSPRDISILSRFSLLRAFGGGGGVAVAPTNRVPNRFMTGDAASEQSSREGQSRRPAASHSRTQTSCSAERARALAASSPSHPRQREGSGATETSERRRARAAYAQLAPSGPCRPGAPLQSRSPWRRGEPLS